MKKKQKFHFCTPDCGNEKKQKFHFCTPECGNEKIKSAFGILFFLFRIFRVCYFFALFQSSINALIPLSVSG